MRILLILGIAVSMLGQTLPDGPGQAVTERMCKWCHGIENVLRAKRTKANWADVVDDMVSRVAKGTEGEIDQVIEYLAAHFLPAESVNVNVTKATSGDLTSGLWTAD